MACRGPRLCGINGSRGLPRSRFAGGVVGARRPKGTCSRSHAYRVSQASPRVNPAGATVVFLGDGSLDGPNLQKTLNEEGWWYACRRPDHHGRVEGQRVRLEHGGVYQTWRDRGLPECAASPRPLMVR